MTNVRDYRNFIGGKFVDGAAGTFSDIDPTTNEVIAEVHEADRIQVDDAVQAARRALSGPWAIMPRCRTMRAAYAGRGADQ